MNGDLAAPGGTQERKRVFLHVGSPKTGSTFLQEILWSQREVAKRQGLLLPLDSFFDHFLATADVREMAHEERFPPRAVGIWERLVDEGLAWDGDVLVSHELFAAATAAQAERAVRAWGDCDVHVVVTARDLARQIPAEWQEHLKHRATLTFADFVAALRERAPVADWFWTVQDTADVCRRWGTAIAPASVHVVTVPGPGAPPDLLWRRFAGLLRLDPDAFDLTASRANASLRAEQAELLRRVNLRLGERLPLPGPYPAIVKEILAQRVLAGRPGTPVALDSDGAAFAEKRSVEIVSELEAFGVDVVGELGELVSTDSSTASYDASTQRPENLADSALLAESIEALSGVLVSVQEETERTAAARAMQQELQTVADHAVVEMANLREHFVRELESLRSRPFHTFVIFTSEQHPRLMRLRVHYWHAVEALRRLRRLGRRS